MSDAFNPTTNDADADANAASARGSAGVAAAQDQDYQYQSRAGRVSGTDTSRVSDFDKDTGTDERMEVTGADRSDAWFTNGKAAFDMHQTLNYDAVLNARREALVERERARKDEDAERSMRLRHAEQLQQQAFRHTEERFQDERERSKAEAEQTRRHYEDMHTLRALGIGGTVDAVVETIAGRTADKVCERLSGMSEKED